MPIGEAPMPIKVMHVINWLNIGGAEVMLCNLLAGTDRSRFEPVVCTLVDVMPLAGRVRAMGVPVHTLGMRPGVPDPFKVLSLARLVRSERPDVIQTWLFQSDLIGSLAALISTRAPVVWGVHHTEHDPATTRRATRLTVAACARLSRSLPARIVCCSEATRRSHLRKGYAAEKMEVITNGFDVGRFRPDPLAGPSLRAELGLGPEARLIGHVARFDPQKDHANFLNAAGLLAGRFDDLHFVLCGNDVGPGNVELMGHVARNGLAGRCHLLGPRGDVPRVLAGLDLVCSSSFSGEAFPMILGEAMACGTPCVTTDVGDSAAVVGPSGRVVPPRDPVALAGAWADILSLPPTGRAELGRSARRWVEERFALPGVVRAYETLYETVVLGRSRRARAPGHGVGRAAAGGVPEGS